MTAPQAATIGPRILSQIATRITSLERYVTDDADFQLLRWQDEIAQLRKASPPFAFIAEAQIAHLRGDIDLVEEKVESAATTGANRASCTEALLVAYSNLGFAARALNVLRDGVDIRLGNINECLVFSYCVAAFGEFRRLKAQAENGNVVIKDAELIRGGDAAGELLSALGVTDDQTAQVIDVAGSVLRERSLFWLNLSPELLVDSDAHAVLMRWHVDVDAEEASNMTLQAAERLIAKDLDTLPFLVSFLGVRA